MIIIYIFIQENYLRWKYYSYLYIIIMNRDTDYENNNIGYDSQYTEEDGGGIKCNIRGFLWWGGSRGRVEAKEEEKAAARSWAWIEMILNKSYSETELAQFFTIYSIKLDSCRI